VVEGSEIYNFPVHHLVHFCSDIGRKRARSSLVRNCSARTWPRAPRALLKSVPTPRAARSLAGRPHPAIPCGPSQCSSVQARRPMPLVVPRVRPGVLHPAGTLSPSSLKPDQAVHSVPQRPAPLPARAATGASGGRHGEPRARPADFPN
jgi:hypothetical protein